MISLSRSIRSKSSDSNSSNSNKKIVTAGSNYVTQRNGRLYLNRPKLPRRSAVASDLPNQAFDRKLKQARTRTASLDSEPEKTPFVAGGLPFVPPPLKQHHSAPLLQQPFYPVQPMVQPQWYHPSLAMYPPPPYLTPPQLSVPAFRVQYPTPRQAPTENRVREPTHEEFEQLKRIDAHYNEIVASSKQRAGHNRTHHDKKPKDANGEMRHFCAKCGRRRSRKYHKEHSHKSNAISEPSYCRKCKENEGFASGEDLEQNSQASRSRDRGRSPNKDYSGSTRASHMHRRAYVSDASDSELDISDSKTSRSTRSYHRTRPNSIQFRYVPAPKVRDGGRNLYSYSDRLPPTEMEGRSPRRSSSRARSSVRESTGMQADEGWYEYMPNRDRGNPIFVAMEDGYEDNAPYWEGAKKVPLQVFTDFSSSEGMKNQAHAASPVLESDMQKLRNANISHHDATQVHYRKPYVNDEVVVETGEHMHNKVGTPKMHEEERRQQEQLDRQTRDLNLEKNNHNGTGSNEFSHSRWLDPESWQNIADQEDDDTEDWSKLFMEYEPVKEHSRNRGYRRDEFKDSELATSGIESSRDASMVSNHRTSYISQAPYTAPIHPVHSEVGSHLSSHRSSRGRAGRSSSASSQPHHRQLAQ